MKKYKVKIKKACGPEHMAYGGQANYGLDTTSAGIPTGTSHEGYNTTLQPVNWDEANLEAERGEYVVGDIDGDGMHESATVGGKKHSEGGTPLNLKPGSFVYSDNKKMALAGPELDMFGKNGESKKKYTPATLAKQYDLNKYKAILQDKHADPMQKKTAELMLAANQKKLGQLAMVQESKKGFPTGMPQIAAPQMAFGGYIPQAGDGMNMPFTAASFLPPAQLDFTEYPTFLPNQPMEFIPGTAIPKAAAPAPMQGFNFTMTPAATAPTSFTMDDARGYVAPKKGEEKKDYAAGNPNNGWQNSSKIAMLDALTDKAHIKKYMPYMPANVAVTPEATFMDPTRELAANAEQAYTQQMFAGMSGNPQRQRAVASQIQGQMAAANADTMGRYAGQNTQIANQFAGINAEVTNNLNAMNSKRAQELYDKTTVANQQYDNSMRQYKNNIAQNLISGNEAAAKIGNLNSVTKHYYTDANGRIQFRSPQAQADYFNKDVAPDQMELISKHFQTLLNRGMTADQATRILSIMMGKNAKSPMDLDGTSYGG